MSGIATPLEVDVVCLHLPPLVAPPVFHSTKLVKINKVVAYIGEEASPERVNDPSSRTPFLVTSRRLRPMTSLTVAMLGGRVDREASPLRP